MLAATLTFSGILCFLALMVGVIIGWIVKEQLMALEYNNFQQQLHPEFLDANGNVLPDEILAVRFENDFEEHDDED